MENKEVIKEKIKYETLMRYLVESNYEDILITKKKNSFIVNLKKSGWDRGYNSQEYKTFILYCELAFDELTVFITDLLNQHREAVVNTMTALINKNYEKTLKEIEEVLG